MLVSVLWCSTVDGVALHDLLVFHVVDMEFYIALCDDSVFITLLLPDFLCDVNKHFPYFATNNQTIDVFYSGYRTNKCIICIVMYNNVGW